MGYRGNYVSRGESGAKNYVLPKMGIPTPSSTAINPYTLPFTQRNAKLPQYYIMPLQLQRISHDISLWREAISVAENALYPSRYNIQRMFADTILDGHTIACMTKRRDLTLLKDFVIKDSAGNINDDMTMIFKNKQWFLNMVTYVLDAQFYGYTLIQLGDMQSPKKGVYNFPQLTNIRRWNVEPDRQNLVSIPLQRTGINFLDPSVVDDNGIPYTDFLVYVDTPTDIGQSICGYGLLYNTAIYGIILKSNTSNNADYNQMFSTPYRHAKTQNINNEGVKGVLEKALIDMGSAGWMLTGDDVTVDFKETNTGTGFQSFASLEDRMQKMISKLLLGHGSAMDETSGKLGGGQGKKGDYEDSSPAGKALLQTEKKQDTFVLNVLNDTILPKLRNLGMPIPEGFEFGITNDKEEFEARKKKDEADLVTAQVAQTMKAGGLKYDSAEFTKITGIPTEEIEEPVPPQIPNKNLAVQNKLKKIYNARN